MAGCWGRGLDSQGPPVGVPTAFLPPAPCSLQRPPLSQSLPSGLREALLPVEGSRLLTRERCCGNCEVPIPGLLLPSLSSSQGFRRVETHHRLVSSQQVPPADGFQDGDCGVSDHSHQGGGFHGFHRPSRCILPDPSPPCIKEVSKIYVRGGHFPVQVPVLRDGHGTTGARVFQLVSEWAHRRSIRLLRYLDDWLIIATSLAECQAHLRMVLDFVLSLGVKINSKKSDLTPKQVSCYLGMEINTVSSRVFPSEARILKLKSHISKFLRSTYNSAKDFQVLLGLLASMEKLVPGGRMRMRAMQWQLKELWHFPMDPDTLLPSNPQMSLDLQWWSQSTHLRLGTPLGCPPPQSLLFTDASTEGWGAHWNKSTASGLWSPSEKSLHINVLEMRAVLLALKKFAPQLQGQKLGLMSDNSSVVAYLNKQGGTKSADLCKATREVLQLAEFHAISLRANYIPGKKNILADSLSRKFQIIQTEWSLNQGIANRVIRKWGSPNIDLFATSLNKKLPLYFSPLKDDEALGEDALQQDWSNRDVYAYPPQGIIQRVLAKVRESRNMHMTLIAPLHPRALWFPDLLDLLTERPITLPLVEDLITQPMTGTPHGNLISLSLHAWRLSSKSSERRVFRDRMPRTRPTQSESPPRRSTMGNGRSMWIGAIGEASIHSLLLDRRWSTSSDS